MAEISVELGLRARHTLHLVEALNLHELVIELRDSGPLLHRLARVERGRALNVVLAHVRRRLATRVVEHRGHSLGRRSHVRKVWRRWLVLSKLLLLLSRHRCVVLVAALSSVEAVVTKRSLSLLLWPIRSEHRGHRWLDRERRPLSRLLVLRLCILGHAHHHGVG